MLFDNLVRQAYHRQTKLVLNPVAMIYFFSSTINIEVV